MNFIPQGEASRLRAFIPRTAALFILLYQIRLLAADMADTSFFIAALAGALVTALFLNGRKIRGRSLRPAEALLVIALIPWVIRFFIALPRFFIPDTSGGGAILLDSLLLNLDRNNFSALLPFYWTAASSYFSRRSRVFLRADIIAADTIFLVMFSIAPTASMDAYRWPILMISLFALVLFLQILSLVLSMPPELKLRKKESVLAGSFLFLLIFLGGALFIRPFQEKAVERGGGLIEPKLFRFDFSQFIRLESEISVSDDLVLIVKKDPEDTHTLLRRYTLSGYGQKQGFFRLEDVDEAAHPQYLPGRPAALPVKEIENYRVTEQEYYLVNFDASAFIGMNMPVEITPFETWDASSFNSAYAVKSHTSEVLPFELAGAVRGEPGPETLELSAEEYALYTNYGGDEDIASFAREIVENPGGRRQRIRSVPPYWEKIQMVYDRLKYGEYRYSLKPGIAPDGDQLKHFLFTSKKGYCSYFAFAFTLALRSLGIPSRVAAGFFVDPSTEAFNYYPVRQDMAHAWVEVWFPGYGWIEYDPTSEEVADGEEYRFSDGTPPELFERLMKEILENRSKLKVKEGEDEENTKGNFADFGNRTARFLRRNGLFIAVFLLVLLFLVTRAGFYWLSFFRGNPRKKSLCLWAHAKRRLALAGLERTRAAGTGEAEWAKALDSGFNGFYALYLDSAAARFAPDFSAEDKLKTAAHYRVFNDAYRGSVSAGRRILAWLLPPLALFLPPSKNVKKYSGRAGGMLLLFIVLLLFRGEAGRAQDDFSPADILYEDALAAEAAENWERAIELLGTGAERFPDDVRFSWTLGNLYYYRELYRLAWDEYRRAENITPWAADLLYQLANTAGYLNRNEISAEYLERLLDIEPDNIEAVGGLAWMYFKLHRLPEGERLLVDVIKRTGEDTDLSMTLGTIYSDMFRYDEAKDAYERAAKGAREMGARQFESLVHYNCSILESRFYQFSLAYERTNASLEAMDRSSGRLARGEILLRRMELPRALAEYQDAYGMDSSPLSKLNLAEAYLAGGRLTEAALYAEDCLKAGDESWMLNYGIDPVRYKRDIHEILDDIYEGLLNAEAFAAPAGLKEKAQSLFRAVSYRFKRSVHRHLFRKYSLLAAEAYGQSGHAGGGSGEEIHVEALLQYFDAFEDYPRRALTYLREARNFEEPLIPGSSPTYNFFEARLLKNRELIAETLTEFDPLWERDMLTDVYAELAARGGKAERIDAAERLFALNRGALLQNGTKLPAALRIETSDRKTERILKKAVKAAGLEPLENSGLRYTLILRPGEEGKVSAELYDGGRGIALFRKDLSFSSLPGIGRAASSAAFSRELRDGVFNAF